MTLADRLWLYLRSQYPDTVVSNFNFLVSGFEISLALLYLS